MKHRSTDGADERRSRARYSVGTWDAERHAFTPQPGVDRWCGLSRSELKDTLRQLQGCGYTAHRTGNTRTGHDSDSAVWVERTDDLTPQQVLTAWTH